ncbi:polymer-forming cytoskeletal protein [Haloarcula rara]|uniref:polymer-forming cytoskeletal protein n=1 Tax=Haloarcula rara TaxID=3033387 RepID=UPI0023E7A0E1|nr:polymer-forming cytoskeletal protein [Halomicroarcula sp. SHR3]
MGASYFELNGTVDGNVRAGAESVVLGSSATVGGSVRYDAESFVRAPGATVEGSVVQDERLGETVGPDLAVPGWLGALYGLLANFLLGVILLAVFPAFSTRVADGVADRPARSAGVGLLTVFVVPLLLVLVALTIVGIPLSLVGAVGFAALVWAAIVYGQYALGVWVLSFTDRDSRWLALVVGLVGVTVLGAVPVLGALLDLAVFLLGLGALVLALRGAYERRGEEPAGGRQTTLDEVTGDTSAA